MKRIVICYDGTWNAVSDPATVTNVVRLGQAVKKTADDKVQQVVYYNAGVGSGGPLDRCLGGVFGVGLRNNVKRGLAFLTLNWDPQGNDEIYIFGFSRGAYSARALAGVIGAIGGIPKQEKFHELEKVWDYYRIDPNTRRSMPKEKKEAFKQEYIQDSMGSAGTTRPLIKCLGVWDTVGSYGVPEGLGLGALARKATSWTRGFHNNTIGKDVEVALHAIAIDERRSAFRPTAWVVAKANAESVTAQVEQVWFAGSHSNVGGGYERSGLADLTLIWMMARAQELTDLDFDEEYIAKNFWPCAACSLYNSDRGWVLSKVRPFLRPMPTSFFEDAFNNETKKKERQEMMGVNEKVHWSVIERLNRPALVDGSRYVKYAPANIPKGLPDDRMPDAFNDPRVAKITEREEKLIQACRARGGMRVKDCALFCKLGAGKAPSAGFSRAMNFFRDMLSTDKRRDERRRGLRKNWDVNEEGLPGS